MNLKCSSIAHSSVSCLMQLSDWVISIIVRIMQHHPSRLQSRALQSHNQSAYTEELKL